MSSLTQIQVLILSIAYLSCLAYSAPTVPGGEVVRSWQSGSGTRLNHADFVTSETEFQRILDRLKEEADGSVSNNPRNYVDGDASIEEIVRLIEAAESTDQVQSTTLASTDQQQPTEEPSNTPETVTLTRWSETTEVSSPHLAGSIAQQTIGIIQDSTTTQSNSVTGTTEEIIPSTESLGIQATSTSNSTGLADQQTTDSPLSLSTTGLADHLGTTLETTGELETYTLHFVQLSESPTTKIPLESTTEETFKECPICLDSLTPADKILKLICGHEFHNHCITYWYRDSGRSNPRCPLCRGPCKYYIK